MKKIVPDPPASHRRTTANIHFGTCAGAHPHMFAVCPDADIEDALPISLPPSLRPSKPMPNFATCFPVRWQTRHGPPGNRWKSVRR